MLNWKTWCRLCGEYASTERVDAEISQIAQQFFEVNLFFFDFFYIDFLIIPTLQLPTDASHICIDCKSYVHDLQNFLIRAINVAR